MRLVLLDDTQIDAIAEALASSDNCINDRAVNCITCGHCKTCSFSYLKEKSIELDFNDTGILKAGAYCGAGHSMSHMERQLYKTSITKIEELERIMKL